VNLVNGVLAVVLVSPINTKYRKVEKLSAYEGTLTLEPGRHDIYARLIKRSDRLAVSWTSPSLRCRACRPNGDARLVSAANRERLLQGN